MGGGRSHFMSLSRSCLTDGGFDGDGRFVRVEPPPEDVLEDLLRHRVFRFLLDEDAVQEEVVERMLTSQATPRRSDSARYRKRLSLLPGPCSQPPSRHTLSP